MRVLHVIPSVAPSQGGPSRAIVEMERALAARCVEVTTVTTDDDGGSARLPVRCGAPIAEAHATRWYFRRDTGFYKLSSGMGRWLAGNVRNFDVVHAHALFSFAPIAAAIAARGAGVPYVLRPLGVLAPYGMAARRSALKRLSFSLIERRLLEGAAAVHFTSRAEAADARALGLNCRSVVIPLGVDAAGARAPRRADAKTLNLLFLSRLDPKKNLEGLLRGLSLAVARGGDVRLEVAGEGDAAYTAALQALARQLGLDERVAWLGHVDGGDKAEAFARADAFALPSFSENFGISVVEALAAGLPCLVSDQVAVQDEIVAAGAGVATGTEVEEVAQAIGRLAADPLARDAMARAASRLARDTFSTEAMGLRLEALYRELAGGHRMARAA